MGKSLLKHNKKCRLNKYIGTQIYRLMIIEIIIFPIICVKIICTKHDILT